MEKRLMMFDDEDLGAAANQVKEFVVLTLVNQGKLTQEDADSFNSKYAIVVIRKGWLGSVIDKALGLEKNKKVYEFVRIGG